MTEVGLSLIAIAWLLQFLSIIQKQNKRLSVWFVLLYLLGAGVLTLEGFITKAGTSVILNVITLFASLIVLLRLVQKN